MAQSQETEWRQIGLINNKCLGYLFFGSCFDFICAFRWIVARFLLFHCFGCLQIQRQKVCQFNWMVDDLNHICSKDMSLTADRVLSTCPRMSVVTLESFTIAVIGLTKTAGFPFFGCGVPIILTGVVGHGLSGVCKMEKKLMRWWKLVSEKVRKSI